MSVRIDKWLKVSRLIKRRTIAQMACDQGRVFVNDRPAKSAVELKTGDRVHLELGSRALTVAVARVPDGAVPAQDASTLYEIVEEIRRPAEVLEWMPDEDND
ncbi:MAG: RNA-binding S4 domain-containing protein [Terriglobales bacterium]